VSADGVVRDARWQEKLVRCSGRDGDEAWRERVLPEKRVKTSHAHDEHDHPDLALVAKHYVKKKVELVDRERKLIIDVDAPEFGSIGFDGDFDAAARLVSANVRKQMHPLDRKAPEGAIWLERRTGARFQRVLWSSDLDLPLAVEAGDDEGTQLQKLTVNVASAPEIPPWEAVASYPHKEWADLGD
jgi:hypothetical protein